jgi:hypothetical protein
MSVPGWNPNMTFRADRSLEDEPTTLERYAEANILSLFGFYLPMRQPHNLPNFDFGPIVEAAARMCEKIVRHSTLTLHLHAD